MPKSLSTRAMREQPNLEQLKRQAKELLHAVRDNDAAAVAEVRTHYHDADLATFALHDAQLVLARAYGFDSWPKLKAYVDGVTVARLRDAVTAGDMKLVQSMLAVRPELAEMDMAENDEHQALHYAVIARNPEMVRVLIRTATVPPDFAMRVELAGLVLARNPRLDVRDDLLKSTPLGWACRWGRVELVQLLLDRGADAVEPNAWAEKRRHTAILDLLRKG